jgi:hypothetical protein
MGRGEWPMASKIHRGATREQQILLDTAFDEGRELGRSEMLSAAIALLERHGDKIGAQLLSEARPVEGTKE